VMNASSMPANDMSLSGLWAPHGRGRSFTPLGEDDTTARVDSRSRADLSAIHAQGASP
jgi:hypothetical protein